MQQDTGEGGGDIKTRGGPAPNPLLDEVSFLEALLHTWPAPCNAL